MSRRVMAALGAMAALVAACGTAAGTASSSARTAGSPASAATPSPYSPISTNRTLRLLPPAQAPAAGTGQVDAITCTGPIGASDAVAVVQLHTGAWVMRDYADPAHPRTVCQLPYAAQLIDSHHLLAGGANYVYAVVEVPDVVATWFQLPPVPGLNGLLAISPDLDEVVYLVSDQASGIDHIHVVTAAGDVEVAAVPAKYGRCGSPDDSKQGDFTRSGRYAYALDQSVHQLASMFVMQGSRVLYRQVPPQGQWAAGTAPGMAVWSPTDETLYYSQGGDVWKWTAAGGAHVFLPGVAWTYPTISADGRHLAYAQIRADGLHNVFLVDLASGGRPQVIGKGARVTPAFLSSNLLWYRAESQGPCGPGGDQPLVYDLADGSEASSIIDFVGSVWPSTSSNF